ncbi:MAG TPA: exodeoxyribonuclease VII large subunit [Gemmatimonadaceae bacterium]|nr:exodeoxyribonuclease VII large subunit [Gemmatimonadaceae bacterium]
MSARRERGAAHLAAHESSQELDLFSVGGSDGEVELAPSAQGRKKSRAGSVSRSEPIIAPDPGARPESAISISTLTRIAKDVVEGAFTPLWVRGEVSDFKAHRNGHWYFCLRDESSQLRCVVWARDRQRIPAAPDDGMQLSAYGQLTVYPARGDIQFRVSAMEAAGDGLWRKALELSIAKLREEGLLAAERKRPLSAFPRRVAVVTSPDGAALHDILAVVRRRCPVVEIVVVPARVQGEGAVEELIAAIERVSRWRDADTVIVGRGGGAREDLWAFNDERVARALAGCAVPTISAVGHEVDVTLCDMVADLRAPTPSAAAEAAVPVLADLRSQLSSCATAMRYGLQRRAASARTRLLRGGRDLHSAAERTVERRHARLQNAAGRLNALSPLATLARGYAVARDDSGAALTERARFTPGLHFLLTLRDGQVGATVDDGDDHNTTHPPTG